MSAWTAWYSPRGWKVHGEIVDVQWIDGDVSKARIENKEEVGHRICRVERDGRTPLVYLVLACQRAGGIGVVIVDNDSERCDKFDQFCMPGADEEHGEYWGRYDLERPWRMVRIPTVLVRGGDLGGVRGRKEEVARAGERFREEVEREKEEARERELEKERETEREREKMREEEREKIRQEMREEAEMETAKAKKKKEAEELKEQEAKEQEAKEQEAKEEGAKEQVEDGATAHEEKGDNAETTSQDDNEAEETATEL